jgi:pyruvate/2-oxoglutarate dehydrogenase complex dihydrolipoamide acyltransferase (E2) component
MTQARVELRLPDLGLDGVKITACTWHAARGARVVEGDRLLEVLAGEVTVDLDAPATGILIERCVAMDDSLATGQLLAIIEVA